MKSIITAVLIFISAATFAQKKEVPDSVIQITWTFQQYNAYVQAIQQNIDSKKLSVDLIELVNKNAQLVAVKPKEQSKSASK